MPFGPLAMSWTNEICSGDAEERALVIGIINAAGYAFNAWLPLLTYPQVEAPRFRKGFIFSTVAFVVQGFSTVLVWYLARRESRKKAEVVETSESESEAEAEIEPRVRAAGAGVPPIEGL